MDGKRRRRRSRRLQSADWKGKEEEVEKGGEEILESEMNPTLPRR